MTSLNLLFHMRSLLMKTYWNWRPRERTEIGGRRSNWRTKETHAAGNGKGIFFMWGGTISYWGQDLNIEQYTKGCNNHSECNPVLWCHLWGEKKRATNQTLAWPEEPDRLQLIRPQRFAHDRELSINKHHWIIFSRS